MLERGCVARPRLVDSAMLEPGPLRVVRGSAENGKPVEIGRRAVARASEQPGILEVDGRRCRQARRSAALPIRRDDGRDRRES